MSVFRLCRRRLMLLSLSTLATLFVVLSIIAPQAGAYYRWGLFHAGEENNLAPGETFPEGSWIYGNDRKLLIVQGKDSVKYRIPGTASASKRVLAVRATRMAGCGMTFLSARLDGNWLGIRSVLTTQQIQFAIPTDMVVNENTKHIVEVEYSAPAVTATCPGLIIEELGWWDAPRVRAAGMHVYAGRWAYGSQIIDVTDDDDRDGKAAWLVDAGKVIVDAPAAYETGTFEEPFIVYVDASACSDGITPIVSLWANGKKIWSGAVGPLPWWWRTLRFEPVKASKIEFHLDNPGGVPGCERSIKIDWLTSSGNTYDIG